MKNKYFWQVIINDPRFLSGERVAMMINRIAKFVKADNIVVDSVEGSGTSSEILLMDNFIVSNSHQLCEMLGNVEQLSWGDFFFYSNKNNAYNYSGITSYTEELLKSEALLRAVDNTYFYIYLKNEFVAKNISTSFQLEEIKKLNIDKLEFPE